MRWLKYYVIAVSAILLMGAYPGTKQAFLNVVQTWTAAQTFTVSPISTVGVAITTGDMTQSIPNSSTATVLHKLAIFASGVYQARLATTGSTTNVIGICDGGCGAAGTATIAWGGSVQCIFDGATTVGDWVVASTSTAGDCHDAGATVPTTVQVLGQVTSTNGGAGTYTIDMNPVGITSAINAKSNPGGSSGQLQINSSNSFGGITLAGDCTFSTPNITCTKINGDANVAFLDINQTYTKAQAVTPVPLTPGAGTIAVNGSLSNGFTLTIGNDSNTLGNPSNLIAGQNINFQLTVGSGGHTGFTAGTNYKFVGGTAPTWSTAAGKIDVLSCWAVTTSVLECSAMIDVR